MFGLESSSFCHDHVDNGIVNVQPVRKSAELDVRKQREKWHLFIAGWQPHPGSTAMYTARDDRMFD
ncbi:unnamed protein product [Prunus armeniaca]|uniref:Uncharacterized protein n=1 Tax=Prunus armeniaca TaxID=36596 RepID=A0A6J5V2G6_PRUAR|nr:unnamed protein product [Prunus armeniaca]CAB4312852.1 unnamed protein product [Prunus armeniaca]